MTNAMSENGFSRSYSVKWADLDPIGHARHSVYDDYAVDTRVRWMEANGFPPRRFAELGFGPVILRQLFRQIQPSEPVEELRSLVRKG